MIRRLLSAWAYRRFQRACALRIKRARAKHQPIRHIQAEQQAVILRALAAGR